ncbi:hypothetical protein JCM11641_003602 [Rhodosporidiobolus odoratus]
MMRAALSGDIKKKDLLKVLSLSQLLLFPPAHLLMPLQPHNRHQPKRSHGFFILIVVLGWLCPPIAILVRFGVGWDFFLNIILTICGYIPGHAHNFYCQSVRNNKTKSRTPRWAVRAGLVEVEDNRAGRHQWAHRYDERVSGAGAGRYAGDNDSIAGEWDGRGDEPARPSRRLNKPRKKHHLAPWDDVVDDDEVEGEPEGELYRNRSNLASPRRSRTSLSAGAGADPLTNEQFYQAPSQHEPEAGGKKKKFGSGLIKNRSRYEQPFDTQDAVSSRTRASGDYQDAFEREINQAPTRPAADARFDAFDQEGPEDAWATARPASASRGNGYGTGSAQRLQPQRTGRAEELDGDLMRHEF